MTNATRFLTATLIVALGATATAQGGRGAAPGRGGGVPATPRPIEMGQSLWTEELTWMEMRDRIKEGYTTVIIGTGGVEQNGPYVAGGKHNYVLTTVLPYIARAIPKSLIAPVVKFVPEGRIEPTGGGHMAYPGTISLENATYHALLTDIIRSYKTHGFTDIILIGDSGGNGAGMKLVADTLNARWSKDSTTKARVHYLPEYYSQDQWSYNYLKSIGITQIDSSSGTKVDRAADTRNGMHDDVYYEFQIAVQNPALIRADERRKAGLLSLHGVDMTDMNKVIEIGKKLAEYRAGIVAKAYEASKARLRK
jgi:creatinine amidohydrolase